MELATLERLRREIMVKTAAATYDHRPFLTAEVKEKFPHLLDNEQLQYARFKAAVVSVLWPRTIYEIGLGWGVSALAFRHGSPGAWVHAIDSGEIGFDPATTIRGSDVTYERLDSANIERFEHPGGDIDLIHIDGGHGLEHKAREIVKAIEARPEWILVDDMHDVMVAAGTFAGLYKALPNPIRALCFENTHTGNLLIHTNRQSPDYRVFTAIRA